MDLTTYGWNEHFQRAIDQVQSVSDEYIPGRISAVFGNSWHVMTGSGEISAGLAGRIRHQRNRCEGTNQAGAGMSPELPAVGDWVALRHDPVLSAGTIYGVLPRHNKLSRNAAGTSTSEQVLAANVDCIFVVMALDQDFNLTRLERYLVTAGSGGLLPVIVLNKADMCADCDGRVQEVRCRAGGIPVHAVSAIRDQGIDEIRQYLAGNKTGIFVGSSGVGKSTIINRLLGRELIAVAGVSSYKNKGRHVTTARQMYLLESGGIVIDTPGIRMLPLWAGEESLALAFDDIESLAENCRFADCRHQCEPGCAVKAAIEAGSLPVARLKNYRKLQREIMFLEARQKSRTSVKQNRDWKVRAHLVRKGLVQSDE